MKTNAEMQYLVLSFFNKRNGGTIRDLLDAHSELDEYELKKYVASNTKVGNIFQSGRTLSATYRITPKGKQDMEYLMAEYPELSKATV